MRVTVLLLSLASLFAADSAVASDSIDAASSCLTDSTTGRDRKDLVRWIFLAMSKHPEIEQLAASTTAIDEESNKVVGALFTRLVADDCATEIRAMIAEHGPASLSKAFEVLGRVAMMELMAHPNVNGTFSGLDRYTDQERISEVLKRGSQP